MGWGNEEWEEASVVCTHTECGAGGRDLFGAHSCGGMACKGSSLTSAAAAAGAGWRLTGARLFILLDQLPGGPVDGQYLLLPNCSLLPLNL